MGKRRYKSDSEDETRIKKKIRRLEKKLEKKVGKEKEYRREKCSSRDEPRSEYNSDRENQNPVDSYSSDENEGSTRLSNTNLHVARDSMIQSEDAQIETHDKPLTEAQTSNGIIQPAEPRLSDNIMSILGDKCHPDKVIGDPIQGEIALRWEEIVMKGLPKQFVDDILKKYPTPSNCLCFDPPKLNLEVKASIQETSRLRDERISSKQESITAGLTAIGKAITLALKAEDLKMVEYLNDAGRIFANIQHTESSVRRSLVLPNVHATFKDTLSSGGLDKTLFGADLEERLKSAKALEKTSKEFRKDVMAKPTPKTQSKNSKSPLGNQNLKQQYKTRPAQSGQRNKRSQYQSRPPQPSYRQRQDRPYRPTRK